MTTLTPNLGLIKPDNADISKLIAANGSSDNQWYHKNNLALDSVAGPLNFRTFTPTLLGTTSNPNLGSGVDFIRRGKFRVLAGLVFAYYTFRFGNTGISVGSGTYFVEAPTVIENNVFGSITPGAGSVIGEGFVRDNSAVATSETFAVAIRNTGNRQLHFCMEAGGLMTNTHPIAWAASDIINFGVVYPYGGEI